MSPDGFATCPHCRAIVTSPICSICGKRGDEEVAAPPRRVQEAWWKQSPEVRTSIRAAAVIAITVAVVGAWWLSRGAGPPDPAALPPPASTTTVAVIETTGQAPTVQGAPAAVDPVAVVQADRQVDEGLAPWETAPVLDLVTGLPLDEDLDHTADIARVGELLARFPYESGLAPLEPPRLRTLAGEIDLAPVEASQPFAARSLRGADGTELGELWLIASGGTEPGDAYLTAARDRWGEARALDRFAADVGVRIWRLAGDETRTLWAGELEAASLVLVQAPAALDPRVLTDALEAWREAVR